MAGLVGAAGTALARRVAAPTARLMQSASRIAAGERILQAAIEGGRLPVCFGDPTLLRQLWMNLLANAVKFTSRTSAPLILVEGRVLGNECVHRIRDSGAGFDTRYAEKLFGVFQRLHAPLPCPAQV